MKFTFASWNVNYRRFKDSHLTFLSEIKPDILALQEVSPHFFSKLSSSNLFSNYHYSLDYNYIKRGADSSRPRKRGCAVLSSGDIRLRKPLLILDLPYPEKCLILDAELDKTVIKVCSFHTPPGVTVKELKPLSHVVLAEWLKTRDHPVILGIDANAPDVDHPNFAENVWYWDDEPKLLGEERIHDLRDAYRDYLMSNPDLFETIVQDRPEGPLAVSHMTGKGRNPTERRYDFIFITPGIRVKKVEYLFEEACAAGSDHALVYAQLEIDS
jgi:endonuclease/exonuclease/phosphatase family metal-dependent hydrolase